VILQELKQQLLSLNPEEKVQIIDLLAQSLGGKWQGIEKTPSMLILWIKVRQKFMQVSPLRLNSALTLNPSPMERYGYLPRLKLLV